MMRVVNEKYETITDYDLNTGRLVTITAVREDADPIDNITKFAWTPDDYEEVYLYVHSGDITPSARIAELKERLASTDYVVIKIAEGSATMEEYSDVIQQRRLWRCEINKLEEENKEEIL